MFSARDFPFKRVIDPVHGSIGLTRLESAILGTRSFLRLRNVKHLGLADLVYPTADFSRFSHSLGACHAMSAILASLKNSLPDREVARYRLAALLHDIGHYPLSHPTERAIDNHYKQKLIVKQTASPEIEPLEEEPPGFLSHERVGKEILRTDTQISRLLRDEGFDPEKISAAFMREELLPFKNLISSDLDADRLDYLLRMARTTGLPYGTIDFNYLCSQLTLDSKRRICLKDKAVRTADHFLLSRFFSYQQIAFHKSVVALEQVLEHVVRALLEHGYFECDERWIGEAIASSEWSAFDDGRLLEMARRLRDDTTDEVIATKVTSILERKIPKLVAEKQYFAPRTDSLEGFRLRRRALRENVPKLAERFGIPEDLWFIWTVGPLKITGVGSHVPVSQAFGEGVDEHDAYEQSIRILKRDGSSLPIGEVQHSLMSSLANSALFILRIYVLFPGAWTQDQCAKRRPQIEAEIRERLPEMG